MTTIDQPLPTVDLTDPDLLSQGMPHEQFRAFRETSPIHWVEQEQAARHGMATEAGNGYYALTRHADVAAVSKNSKVFSSWENGAIIRFPAGIEREMVEMQRVIIINQDAPEHTHTRRIVSRAFTPRAVGGLDEVMHQRAEDIVRTALEKGEVDFVTEVAAELPLQVIADLLGVPQEDRGKLFEWSNQMMSGEDPEYAGQSDVASAEILGYAMAMAADRLAHPREDLVTQLVHADKDGRGLTEDEFGFFVIALTVAGNETTRNAMAHGMNSFLDHPDQWELFKRERPTATMVDEVIRWATPVNVFQRTALEDVELNGVRVRKGQRVALFYGAANFDPEVFDDPYAFDIRRDPNPHLSFGGHGAHYCIGANLARMEVGAIFNALADIAPRVTRLAEADRLRHSWINGIKHLRVGLDA
ncbi:cytochrome P450 [Nocardioides pocheonensis]|uniref:Cytochrome P450 n=1 Tax=Nocardioides pocheonensis TaxID=661485 RepID=A0A3N0GLM8_9ACTN|nr:cytochrome P450 [Nocardioides pocheonensis]RNM13086.1 cytochrome P450 [Nocardioides pocheonensis]